MKQLSALLLILILALSSGGCRKKADETEAVGAAPGANKGSEGINPMTSAPLPIAPVTGAETVQGAGGGVGDVMKDRARQVAGNEGRGTTRQMPPNGGDPNGEEDGGY